ncbi:MAG: nucleotide exchange factor GrpE [Actinobacteria bacterium]|nr:nucleotide exchange factor GrpE [Actinomycetota bacterium]
MAARSKRASGPPENQTETQPQAATPGPAAPAGDGAAQAVADAELQHLKADMAALETRHTDVLNRLTRTQADFSNYRRRTETEARELVAYANQAFAFDVLRVADGLERAFASVPSELRGFAWLDGVALVHAQLRGVLDGQGVTPIPCKPGDALDPNVHQVVVSDSGDGPSVIAAELQRGYKMHERVLRPALVKAGPASAVPSAEPPPPSPAVTAADAAQAGTAGAAPPIKPSSP